MKVKEIVARSINDTRKEKTIEISLTTDKGTFTASAPTGKSKGMYEIKSYKKSLKEDIKAVNNHFIRDINLTNFDDLKFIESSFNKRIGGNTLIAIEYAFLKALAKKNNKQVWQLINPKAKKIPMPVGNIIGGGAHSSGKKPDFQEFQLIPITSFEQAVKINKRALENAKRILKNLNVNFRGKKSDENAWQTSLENDKVIEVLKNLRDNMKDEFKVKIHLGMDIAASSFFKNGKYVYKNLKGIKNRKEQIDYMSKLAKDFFYLEDAMEENDFLGFKEIMKKSPKSGLIVGDDLVVTNLDRIKIAKNSINAVIIKPNQIGSLIQVKEVVKYCKKNNLKIIFSHRSGETSDDILADLAFGFQADFIKTGVIGKGRDEKLNRLIEIERSL